MEKKTRHPSSVDFPILEIVITNIRLHVHCTQILLEANLVKIKIYGLHQGTINIGLRRRSGQGISLQMLSRG